MKSILNVWTFQFTHLLRSILDFKIWYKLILNKYTLIQEGLKAKIYRINAEQYFANKLHFRIIIILLLKQSIFNFLIVLKHM